MANLIRRAIALAALLGAAISPSSAATAVRALEPGAGPAPLTAPAPLLAAPAAPGSPFPSLTFPAAKPAPVSAPEARAVAAETLAQARSLPTSAPLAAFAEREGLGFAMTPFAHKSLMGLDSDHLAQYVSGDRRVYMNWDYVGGDRRALESAGLSPVDARTTTALAAAPVLAHEWRHAELRSAFGADFPGVAEEEILTHLDQAATLEDALRARPQFAARAPLLATLFLYPHTRKLVDLRAVGFGAFADHVMRRYRGVSPTLDDPEQNARDARGALAHLESAPASTPRGWLEKARANVAFWENTAEVRRLTAFLQDRINAAYALRR